MKNEPYSTYNRTFFENRLVALKPETSALSPPSCTFTTTHVNSYPYNSCTDVACPQCYLTTKCFSGVLHPLGQDPTFQPAASVTMCNPDTRDGRFVRNVGAYLKRAGRNVREDCDFILHRCDNLK